MYNSLHSPNLIAMFLFSLLPNQGVGPPLSTEHTRMLFALRINILAKGYRLVKFVLCSRVVEEVENKRGPSLGVVW